MSEDAFNRRLVEILGSKIGGCHVEMKRSVTYNLAFDDKGNLDLGQNKEGEPTRGGGTGFQKDILLYEISTSGISRIVPRVVVELKLGRVSTHDSIVYSEKARLVRSVYPYVRYGLVVGGQSAIPGAAKVLRFGQEFDFIDVIQEDPKADEVRRLRSLLKAEVEASKMMGAITSGRQEVRRVWRRLEFVLDV